MGKRVCVCECVRVCVLLLRDGRPPCSCNPCCHLAQGPFFSCVIVPTQIQHKRKSRLAECSQKVGFSYTKKENQRVQVFLNILYSGTPLYLDAAYVYCYCLKAPSPEL